MPTLTQTLPAQQSSGGFWDFLRCWGRRAALARSWRVSILLIAIVALSLGDLYMTLTYLDAGAMSEANPVARWLMLNGTPSVLVSWKLATVTVACSILFYTRHAWTCELATWGCCLILTWLTFHWHSYVEEMDHLTHQLAEIESAQWARMTP